MASGYASASAARRAKCFGYESKMAIQDRADACTHRHQNKTSERVCKNKKNGVWQMLNSCLAFMVIVIIGCFAAGSVELAEERKERKRAQKHVRNKYGRTY
jgi:hypothetical protein